MTEFRNDGLRQGMMGARPFQIIHLAIIVGLILAIVAGSNSSSTNPSTLHDVQTERKAGAVILFVCAILNSLIVCYMVVHIRHVHYGDKVIVWCALLSVPFLLVRVIYIMLLAFDDKDSLFNPISPNIYIQAFMQIFMEFICFALYTTAGLLSPKMEKGEYAGEGTELFSGRKNSELGHDAGYRGQQTGVTTRV
jgi:magnesium-transporting ATPase (P-type)